MSLSHRNQFQRNVILAVCLGASLFAFQPPVLPASAQTQTANAGLDLQPRSWVESAADNELRIIKDDGALPLRYRVHKIDSKEDIVREVIETRDGSVARLLERNGQKLTAAEDAAERERLNEILASPEEFVRHHKRDDSSRNDSIQLVGQMPQAMTFAYVPDQPQLPVATGRQIVIDYQPDPKYKPPQTLDNLLTGIEGRMWIDARSRRVVRIEGHVLHPVNFGWGILGKIYPGGTLMLEQANAAGERWIYSRLDTNLTMRVIVKTVAMNDKMTASDFRPLAAPMSVQEAVHALLAMPVALR